MIAVGTRVLIKSECNSCGEYGTVIKNYTSRNGHGFGRKTEKEYVSVELDSGAKKGYNEKSVKIVNKRENMKMEGFSKVAIVNLLDDYNKKDYGFALYDSEYDLLSCDGNDLVVVNARGKNNRVLGRVKELATLESWEKGVTAQVVGVVSMDGYNARIAEEKRQEEVKKQRAKIDKEFRERLDKLQDADYYVKMAERYADRDPELVKLVDQLKELGE